MCVLIKACAEPIDSICKKQLLAFEELRLALLQHRHKHHALEEQYLECRQNSAKDQRIAVELNAKLHKSNSQLILLKFETVACLTTSVSTTRVRLLKALTNALLSLQMWTKQHMRTLNEIDEFEIESFLDLCSSSELVCSVLCIMIIKDFVLKSRDMQALEQERQFVASRRLEVEQDSKYLKQRSISVTSTLVDRKALRNNEGICTTLTQPTKGCFSGYLRHREGHKGSQLRSKRW